MNHTLSSSFFPLVYIKYDKNCDLIFKLPLETQQHVLHFTDACTLVNVKKQIKGDLILWTFFVLKVHKE